MKTTVITFLSFVMLYLPLVAQQGTEQLTNVKGPFLGQKSPDTVPKIFAPGIVSTDAHEFSCSISPDGKEIYFARRHPGLNQAVVMVTRQVNDSWTEPEIASFVNNQFSFEPFITPDNTRLYFQTMKIVDGKPEMMTMYVDRNKNSWSEIKDPGEPFNPGKTMHISATANGTIYTTDISGGMGNEALGIIRKVDGAYQKLELLGPPLNNEKKSQHPWIAPDESYLLFTVRRPGARFTSVLLYAYKKKDGQWSDPKELNLGREAGLPFVSSDGKYLFFTSGEPGKSDIYWVSTRVFKTL